jgi:hypothetical protein
MSGLEKLVEKFVKKPETVTSISQVRRLLKAFGYLEGRNPGSECIFHKKGSHPINVPTIKGRGVKSFYVKKITKYLNLEEWLELQKGERRNENGEEGRKKHKRN